MNSGRDLVRRRNAALGAAVDERLVLAQVLRRFLDRRGAEIAADADVIDAADLDRVIDLAHQHLGGRRAGAGADERHEVDADHAALVGHRLELAIFLAARMAIHLAAAAVRDQRRLGRCGNAVGGGLRAAVAQIHRDAERVHPLDHLRGRTR